MGAQAEQAKGHAKEAAGLFAGDEEMQAEGKAQRVAGEHQAKADQFKDQVVEVVDKVQDSLNGALDKAKRGLHQ